MKNVVASLEELSLAERLLYYTEDVISGKMVACKKHIQACQRFMRDLEKFEDDEEYPYYFDGDALIDFNEWASLFTHVEGVIAGQPIVLTDFQLFVVANIFCWKKKKNGTRRFKFAYIQLARKNAKSQLLALIASYVTFLSGQKEQAYIAGVNREQSGIVYQQILDQLAGASVLKYKYKTSYGKVTHLRSGSIIQPLNKESRKTGDGKFPSLGIIDEWHAHPTSEIYDVIKSGMIGRKNALMVAITTAGLDLNVPAYKDYNYCSKIIDPASVVENEEYFVMICELDKDDKITDKKNWIKANPIVCTFEEGIEDLEGRLKIALEQPDKMTEFLTKHMNLWVQRKEGAYMNLEKWNACGIEEGEVLPDISGKEVYIGVDLSATLDLTSLSFEIPIGDETFVVLGHSFIPAGTMREKMKGDKVPYDLWERQGWITATEGDVIDYRAVQKYIDDMVEKYKLKVKAIYYDEWNAAQFSNEAQDLGYITVKVIQGMKTLAPATKDFRELVWKKKVIHDNNPVINWAFGNAMMRHDHNENFMLDKKASEERIDPVAAIMTAHAHAQFHYQYGDLNAMLTDDYLDNIGW
jgi:phage terminase large subunit-like protein